MKIRFYFAIMTQKVSKERRYVFGIIEFSTIVDPTVFYHFQAFILAYVQAESEEEEKLSVIRPHSLLPKDILHRKGHQVRSMTVGYLQTLT